MRRKYIEWVVVLLIIPLGAAAILFPVFGHARENARRSSCQSNLKQIGLGFKQYVQDYDDKFPPVSVSGVETDARTESPNRPTFGWADSLQPYLKSTCIYQCPSETTSPNMDVSNAQGGYIDYWYNAHLAGRSLRRSVTVTSLIAAGDGDGQEKSNARYSKSAMPSPLPTPTANFVPWTQRHLSGANYLFADGHAKWLHPEEVSNAPGQAYTFGVR